MTTMLKSPIIKPRIEGAYAALITPIDHLGRPDLETFDRLMDFVSERGLDGVVIGGATGEYAHFDIGDRLRLIARAVDRLCGNMKVFASVGTSSVYSTVLLATQAAQHGSAALLLPMPYFFRYEQQDLTAFVEEVCGAVDIPFLLYNLPSFTNFLEVQTAIDLLRSVPNLIGMKDSSGLKTNLQPLADARRSGSYSLLVGDDSLLLNAARAGWDGVISGIACFAPELIAAVYRNYSEGNAEEARRLQEMLDEVIAWVVRLPVPWAVRAGLAARGIANGPMHLPVSAGRARQIHEFSEWLRNWADRHGLPLEGVWSLDEISA